MTENPIVFDADMLSHFATVDRMDILDKLYKGRIIILREVLNELSRAKIIYEKN